VVSLSSVMANADATWAEQIDKESLHGVPFWIHHAKLSEYFDAEAVNPDGSKGRDVAMIVLDITAHNDNRLGQRAVITLGRSDERMAIVDYFQSDTTPVNADGHKEPIGPVHTYNVKLKRGGQTFWRLEEWSEEIHGTEYAGTVRGKATR